MFYYEGLSCPVCQKPFISDDDIVVCPQCGLPHHRDCWKSIGKCYADDQHGTAQQWKRDSVNTEAAHDTVVNTNAAQVCPHCHTENVKYAEFCQRCGRELNGEDWHSSKTETNVNEYTPYGQPYEAYSSSERIGDANAADLAAVVGNNSRYYLARFRRIEQTGTGGWNWAAFLLSPIWLFYRKQYRLGVLFFVLQLLSNVATSILYAPIQNATTNAAAEAALTEIMSNSMFLPVMALSLIMVALQVLLGLRANHFYLHHCEKKISTERAKVPDLSAAELATVGGVSVGSAVLLYIVSSVLLDAILLMANALMK